MRLCLIIFCVALAACGRDAPPNVVAVPAAIPSDLLLPCAGWRGATPKTEGALIEAAAAEQFGRRCANAKLMAISEIVTPQG